LSLAYAKIKKGKYVVFGIVSIEVSFKNYIVAPHALQQTKSGPWSKKVGTIVVDLHVVVVVVCSFI